MIRFEWILLNILEFIGDFIDDIAQWMLKHDVLLRKEFFASLWKFHADFQWFLNQIPFPGGVRWRRSANRHSWHSRPRGLCCHTWQLFPKWWRFFVRVFDNRWWKLRLNTRISVSHSKWSIHFNLIISLINSFNVIVLLQRTNSSRKEWRKHTVLVSRQ